MEGLVNRVESLEDKSKNLVTEMREQTKTLQKEIDAKSSNSVVDGMRVRIQGLEKDVKANPGTKEVEAMRKQIADLQRDMLTQQSESTTLQRTLKKLEDAQAANKKSVGKVDQKVDQNKGEFEAAKEENETAVAKLKKEVRGEIEARVKEIQKEVRRAVVPGGQGEMLEGGGGGQEASGHGPLTFMLKVVVALMTLQFAMIGSYVIFIREERRGPSPPSPPPSETAGKVKVSPEMQFLAVFICVALALILTGLSAVPFIRLTTRKKNADSEIEDATDTVKIAYILLIVVIACECGCLCAHMLKASFGW